MKLPRVSGKEVLSALKKLGFREVRVKGSHHVLYNPQTDKIVVVPVHGSKTLAPKTLSKILKAAGVSPEEFVRHL